MTDEEEYAAARELLHERWRAVKADADDLVGLARIRLAQIWTVAQQLPEGDLRQSILEGWAVLEVLCEGADSAIAIAVEIAIEGVDHGIENSAARR